MTASRDPDRLIHAFLDEGLTELPNRVYEAVRSDIDSLGQRVVIGPLRTPDMNTFAKLAFAAAAVVVFALVGYSLLPGGGANVGGAPPVSPSPSRSVSVPPTASPSPSPSDLAFFADGSIETGRHSMIRSGKSLSVDMPSGWTSHDGFRIYTPAGQLPYRPAAAFIFWPDPPFNVYADPCTKEPLDPPAGDTPAEIATAISSIPGTDLVGGPSDLTIDGHPAKLVSIRVREDVDCAPREFFLWYREADGPAGGRWPDALGDTIYVWLIDVDGTLVWIDGSASVNTTPALHEEMLQIVDSIQFE
jgi:hypothetical protein